jgi:hypothetical protein
MARNAAAADNGNLDQTALHRLLSTTACLINPATTSMTGLGATENLL